MEKPTLSHDVPAPGGSGGAHAAGYTGVLLVHGVGADQRNEVLQAYINALAYWFNHMAGLACRPWGSGRIWVRTQLTDDNRPDAAPSCATIEVVAPAESASGANSHAPATELEFREIWWARSFGLPSAAMGLQVVRTLYRQELFRVLRTWLLRRSMAKHVSAPLAPAGRTRRIAKGIVRLPQRAAVIVYEAIQALWKTAQWLVSIPLVFGLLFLLGLAQRLQPLPGIGPIVGGLAGAFNTATLRWMASMQVYLVDYTRSVAMRHRFEHELADLLADPQCERIVVLAHSMGTVIAYEGLTDVLGAQTRNHMPKPITFICLGQVLRRAWHLARSDAHRLRGALPEAIRWVNFYARYDPISAGALTPRSLPTALVWPDDASADRASTIRASLVRCENHIVINRDSLLNDHGTYFNNLEQVIGPIARELVAGSPELEAVVAGHLATRDDVLRRRWSTAWRSGLPLAAGAAAGVETLLLGQRYHLGATTRKVLGEVLAGGATLPGFFGLLWRLAGQLIGWLGGTLGGLLAAAARTVVGRDRAGPLLSHLGAATTAATELLILVLAVLLVTSLVVLLVAQILAPPLPYRFQRPTQPSVRKHAQPARSSPTQRKPLVALEARHEPGSAAQG